MNIIYEMPCGYKIILTTTAVSTAQSPLQSCTDVSATLEVSCRPAQMSQQLQNMTLLAGAPENALVESESTLLSCRRAWEHLDVLESTGAVNRSVWEVCLWLRDRFTFC